MLQGNDEGFMRLAIALSSDELEEKWVPIKSVVIWLLADRRQLHSSDLCPQLVIWSKNPVSFHSEWINVLCEHLVLNHHSIAQALVDIDQIHAQHLLERPFVGSVDYHLLVDFLKNGQSGNVVLDQPAHW